MFNLQSACSDCCSSPNEQFFS